MGQGKEEGKRWFSMSKLMSKRLSMRGKVKTDFLCCFPDMDIKGYFDLAGTVTLLFLRPWCSINLKILACLFEKLRLDDFCLPHQNEIFFAI
jgi:hypothetical protein